MEVKMESIICPICYGKGGICIGVQGDATPILTPCYGCKGLGWAIIQSTGQDKCGFISHGRGEKDDNCDRGIAEM